MTARCNVMTVDAIVRYAPEIVFVFRCFAFDSSRWDLCRRLREDQFFSGWVKAQLLPFLHCPGDPSSTQPMHRGSTSSEMQPELSKTGLTRRLDPAISQAMTRSSRRTRSTLSQTCSGPLRCQTHEGWPYLPRRPSWRTRRLSEPTACRDDTL